MKSKCAPHLPTFAPLFGIVSPLSKSQHQHQHQQQHLGPRPTCAEDCARCWLELTLAASFLAFRGRLLAQALRHRHHTHLLHFHLLLLLLRHACVVVVVGVVVLCCCASLLCDGEAGAACRRQMAEIPPIPIGGFNNTQNSKHGIRNLIHQQISKQDTSQQARLASSIALQV